jgi:DNA invertase Pin-like site-specific DNA recombinase
MAKHQTTKPTGNTTGEPQSWVAYYRVSTQRQGRSGLGLEAQRSSVEKHIALHGGELINSFTEVESGRKMRNRPELQRALDLAKRRRATLIIAKIDRLARNLHAVTTLMESGIRFVAADLPEANTITIQIMAAMAQFESELASKRTKEALRAAKARGVKIGETGKVLAARHKAEAMRKAKNQYLGVMRTIKAAGITKVRDVRDELNRRNIPSPGGGRWHLPNTHRLLKRIEIIEASPASE